MFDAIGIGPFNPAYDGPYRWVEHYDKTVVIDIPGRGHDTVTLDRIKPSVIDAGDPPAPPRAHPSGRPPLRPRSPSPTNVARAPEVHLQEATDPLPPTSHPPRPLRATSAPPMRVLLPHRTVREHISYSKIVTSGYANSCESRYHVMSCHMLRLIKRTVEQVKRLGYR